MTSAEQLEITAILSRTVIIKPAIGRGGRGVTAFLEKTTLQTGWGAGNGTARY